MQRYVRGQTLIHRRSCCLACVVADFWPRNVRAYLTMNILKDIEDRRPLALLFDWDGTLVDSQEANFQALEKAISTTGAVLERKWFEDRTGMSSREIIHAFFADKLLYEGIEIDALVSSRDQFFMDQAECVAPFANVVSIVTHFYRKIPLAIASGGSGPIIRSLLKKMSFNYMISALVVREDVENGKPFPDIFLAAAMQLGVPPSRCIVFEDSEEGIEAAMRAGMFVYDVRLFRN